MTKNKNLNIFESFIDKNIFIKHSNKNSFEGVCRSIDGYLNIVLEEAKIKVEDKEIKMKTCLIKGTQIKHLFLK